MRNMFFLIAFILIILWAAGFFIFQAGNMIHILPALAIAAVFKGMIKDKEPLYLRKNLTWKVKE
jgi:hypothetical protein